MITPPALELPPGLEPETPPPAGDREAVAGTAGEDRPGEPARSDRQPASAAVCQVVDRTSEHDARRRRLYMILCSAIGAPLLAAFALWDLRLGQWLTALVELVVCAVLCLNLVWIRSRPLSHSAARLTVGLVAILLVYNLVAASGDSSQLLWFFVFPLVAFFVLGRGEGLIWTVSLWMVALGLVIAPVQLGVASIPGLGFRVRMPLSFAVVAIFAYGYERFREQAQELASAEARRLEAEHLRLVEAQERLERTYLEVHESYQLLEEEIEQRKRTEAEKQKLIDDLLAASAQVRRLRGLLPICSACKKIRDDQGYWKQLEEYFHTHSDLVFSHGMCPGCLSEYYPEDFRPGGPGSEETAVTPAPAEDDPRGCAPESDPDPEPY